jgi:hypothetical protein
MSAMNGDKARFFRERKRKLLLRKQLRELRVATDSQQQTPDGKQKRKPAVFVG